MRILSACLLMCCSLVVFADIQEDGFYVGLGASGVENNLESVDSSRIKVAEIIGGYHYNNFLGVEMRLGSSFSSAESTSYVSSLDPANFSQLKRDIRSYRAIYYRPELVNEEAKFYALLGYASFSSQFKVTATDGTPLEYTKTTYSGASYGLGVGFVVTDHLNVNVEAKTFCKEMDDKPNTVSVNLDYRF